MIRIHRKGRKTLRDVEWHEQMRRATMHAIDRSIEAYMAQTEIVAERSVRGLAVSQTGVAPEAGNLTSGAQFARPANTTKGYPINSRRDPFNPWRR